MKTYNDPSKRQPKSTSCHQFRARRIFRFARRRASKTPRNHCAASANAANTQVPMADLAADTLNTHPSN